MIIAIDFDGTLHYGEYPRIGYPNLQALECMRRLKDDGHYIIIYTCRNGDLLLEAINWLIDKGFQFDRVNENAPFNVAKHGGTNTRKVYADVYIDDHNVGGLPSWDDMYRWIEAKNNELRDTTGTAKPFIPP